MANQRSVVFLISSRTKSIAMPLTALEFKVGDEENGQESLRALLKAR